MSSARAENGDSTAKVQWLRTGVDRLRAVNSSSALVTSLISAAPQLAMALAVPSHRQSLSECEPAPECEPVREESFDSCATCES